MKEDRQQSELALKNSISFLLLSKHDNHRSDMLHRLRQLKEVEVLLPNFSRVLRLFTTDEVIAFPFEHQVGSGSLTESNWTICPHPR